MQTKILVAVNFTEEQRNTLELAAQDADFCYINPKEITEKDITEADILVGNPSPDLLRHAKSLKLLQLMSAGTDGYTKEVMPECCILA